MRVIITALLLILLASCRNEPNFDSPVYIGEPLKIGVVGEEPNIREENISFISLSMNDVLQGNYSDVDCVIITKPHLEEASEPQYARIYRQSKVPFVFVDSEKNHGAFVLEELTYKNAHLNRSKAYLMSFYDEQYMNFGLYNDLKTDKTIQDSYSRLFVVLERLKQTGRFSIE